MDIVNRLGGAAIDSTNTTSETERTLARLRTSEIRYRRLFESARDGILILDAASRQIIDVNPFMVELLGYSRDEFLGKELWEIGFFKDKDESQTAFRELQASGYIRYEDLPLQTKAGTRREVEFVSNVYTEDHQQVIQCNIRDMTDHKRTEKERRRLLESTLASEQAAHVAAEAANNMKDEFFATISHELRTPLTSILGWSYMITAGRLDEQATKRANETIARSAQRQKQIIDDLLNISPIITGKLRLNMRPLELPQLIASVVDGVRAAAAAKDIHLLTTLEPHLSLVSGDTERLQQIIWNLLSNSIKFTPPGGRVEVRLAHTATHVEIIISDTGQGIDPELLRYVFDRSRQADSSITRRHGGLGLGLFIARQLVELHGGTVTAQSPGTGQGTTLKVQLPVMSGHRELRDAALTRPLTEGKHLIDGQPSLEDLRVLVVDDEPDARELLAAMLTGRGAEVITVGSANHALAEMERQRFDVLVSDIGMPEMDGYALISQVRQLPVERGGRIPAAAVTAFGGIEDRMRVLMAGYQMHIPKPVAPDELTTLVANLAGRYAQPVALAASTHRT